jgi:hypothetical protein
MSKGKTWAKGYDTTHKLLRKQWAPLVATGEVRCWRCREFIAPGEPWDLGHDDHDRTLYRGPECRKCNRSTAARNGADQRAMTIREW